MSVADFTDMIATLGETTGGSALPRMRDQMLRSPTGRAILRERPRISTATVDLAALRQLAPGTVGRAYVDWLDRFNVTPDSRDPVRFIDDPELAYVMQRYRESHDLYHVLLGFPTSVGAEIVVKMFEYANNGLPMTLLSSVFGPLRLKSATRRRLLRTYAGWALRAGAAAEPMIAVYWEREWSRDLLDLRRELKISDPPMTWEEYRATSPVVQARRAAEAEEAARAEPIVVPATPAEPTPVPEVEGEVGLRSKDAPVELRV